MNTSMQLKNWINTYGLFNVILRGFYTKAPIIPVDDNELLRRMNWQLKVRKKLNRYIKYSGNFDYKNGQTASKKIWWLWFQGSNQAPIIVKKCLETVKYYSVKMGYDVVELNYKNLFDYINLPEAITEKWKKKKIGNANFSDLCRIILLADYGGIWIDSTVYLTNTINKSILDSDIFMFKASFLDMTVTEISNWFMCSKYPNNPFMCSLRDSMINYWLKNNYIDDYFIFHLMAALLSKTKTLSKYVEEIPYYSNTYPLLLGKKLMSPVNENELMHIFEMSSIHKLSYKNLKNAEKNSVYEYLLYKPIDTNFDEKQLLDWRSHIKE